MIWGSGERPRYGSAFPFALHIGLFGLDAELGRIPEFHKEAKVEKYVTAKNVFRYILHTMNRHLMEMVPWSEL